MYSHQSMIARFYKQFPRALDGNNLEGYSALSVILTDMCILLKQQAGSDLFLQSPVPKIYTALNLK